MQDAYLGKGALENTQHLTANVLDVYPSAVCLGLGVRGKRKAISYVGLLRFEEQNSPLSSIAFVGGGAL